MNIWEITKEYRRKPTIKSGDLIEMYDHDETVLSVINLRYPMSDCINLLYSLVITDKQELIIGSDLPFDGIYVISELSYAVDYFKKHYNEVLI